MTAKADASLTWKSWSSIDWNSVENHVKQLQMRIAKAIRENKLRKASSLQWILTHSYYAKLLAVRRVTQNTGAKTPGVDNVIWKNDNQKFKAVMTLRRRGYKTLPLRRVYIPKANGKQRALGIPSMRCRAQQALHLLALEPIAESLADKNAYGFRPKRSCADAVEQCFKVLANRNRAEWVLEGDIKACFDNISHEWLMKYIPMDKIILNKWLKAGYMEGGQLYETKSGTPQGGIISPTLLTLTMAGLEQAIQSIPRARQSKVNLVTYADDFIITGKSKELLENMVKPIVKSFLADRGLQLSEEKTKIVHIADGFDFLGFNIRKYKEKLLIKPSRMKILKFLQGIKDFIRKHPTIETVNLIRLLNPKLRGWANYYRNVVSKAVFAYIDNNIFHAIIRWINRRHPNKGNKWKKKKYFCTAGLDRWVFNAGVQEISGRYRLLSLYKLNSTPIVRHVKILADANPYDSKYQKYFEKRVKCYRNRITE